MGWVDILGVFIVCAGVGAFIDFWIGRSGQRAVRDRLTALWYNIGSVTWSNFGRSEASFGRDLLLTAFGTFKSRKRLRFLVAVVLIGFALDAVAVFSGGWDGEYTIYEVVWNIVAAFLLSTSISFTIFIADVGQRTLPESPLFSLLYLLAAAVSQYILMFSAGIFISYVIISLQVSSFFFPSEASIEYITKEVMLRIEKTSILSPFGFLYIREGLSSTMYIAIFWSNVVSSFGHLLRFFIFIVFLLSFVSKPVKPYIERLLERIIESEKPVFTMVFAAVGAIAKGIIEFSKTIS